MTVITDSVEIEGVKVFYRRAGSGSPVMFVHGIAGVMAWQPFFDMVSAGHELIVPDLPGFGLSDTPVSLNSVKDLAPFLSKFLEAIDRKGAQIIAHSFGGWVTVEAAIESPASFGAICLIAPAGIRFDGVLQPDIFSWSPPKLVESLFFGAAYAKAVLAATPTDEQRQIQSKNWITATKLAQAPQVLYDPELAQRLPQIKCPVKLFWGAQDQIIPVQYAQAWAEQLPQVDLKILQNCGHLPQVEQAQICSDAILEFFSSNRSFAS